MLRRYLFLGLTIMLGAVLVWLIINGRKEETRRAAVPGEVVKTARLSPTRIVAPTDLEAAESPSNDAPGSRQPGVLGPVVIHNRGRVSYHGVLLSLSCLGSGGKMLGTRIKLIPDTIGPGQSLTVTDIALEGVAPGTIRYGISIVYADLGPAPQPGQLP